MKNEFLTPEEAAARIRSGAVMSIAGASELLAALPKGAWIGGSTVYFMTAEGGKVDREHLFCTTFPAGTKAEARHLSPEELPSLASGYVDGGVTLIILPAFSKAHQSFAEDGANYADIFDQPLLGWISGVHLEEIGTKAPTVYDGATGTAHEEGAVLLHVTLAAGSNPKLDIVNIFEQGADPELTFFFEEEGFSAKTAIVNGREVDFANYVTEKGIDTRLPLVADYAGALINVSFQAVDTEAGEVKFYAPVFAGVEYRLARPQENYAGSFAAQVGQGGAGTYSCNCILNYLYGELEGKSTAGFTGPVTFGEVAYILLNQTLVKLELAA